jgi:hypothetical protein
MLCTCAHGSCCVCDALQDVKALAIANAKALGLAADRVTDHFNQLNLRHRHQMLIVAYVEVAFLHD